MMKERITIPIFSKLEICWVGYTEWMVHNSNYWLFANILPRTSPGTEME